ncbi:MAG: type IV secretory system conjugative DNA transfer family protein [Planctomycetes bacterium]|nr:type IV secretory system conjugative DNA transfer family protein [Planctomycetota bacterium]
MTNASTSMPDGWDYHRSFLDDKLYLPQYLRGEDFPLFGISRRPTLDDLRELGLLPETRPPLPLEKQPHCVSLPGVHAIADRREQGHYELYGPARLVLPEELLNRHWLWVGPPGVGKTTQGVQPQTARLLGDRERSLVVFDPKGDQFGVLRDVAIAAGRSRRSVLRLNLADPGGSIGWNPLRRDMTRTEALGIASTLVLACENDRSHDSPFWRNTSIELVVDMLLGLAGDPDEALTLPRLLEVLSLPRGELARWFEQHGVRRFAAFLESGSHNAETCLSDTNMRLVSLLDLDLCAVLSHGELRLERLFEKPTVLVIEMNETRLAQQRPIFNMLVQQLFDRAIEAAERRPDARLRFPLSVVLDEFGSAIGAVPRFPVYLNTLRSRRVGVVAAVQSLSQIRALYREDAGAVLVGFSSKVFFPNVEPDDAEFASVACGTMSVSHGDAVKRTWVARRTYLPEEISRPRVHPVLGRPATFLIADRPAFQAYLTPSFRLPSLRCVLSAQALRRSRPRRRTPLVYEPRPRPEQAGEPFTNVNGLPPAAVLRHLQHVEHRLGLAAASQEVGAWWSGLRRRYRLHPAQLLRFAEEVLHRGFGGTDWFVARGECGCDAPQVLLPYLDYCRARQRFEGGRGDGGEA